MNELLQVETRPARIPMALGQDMYWGFSTDLIAKYRVRWIEMAAVLPMWTNMNV